MDLRTEIGIDDDHVDRRLEDLGRKVSDYWSNPDMIRAHEAAGLPSPHNSYKPKRTTE